MDGKKYKFITENGEWDVTNHSYECVSGKHKGTGIICQATPPYTTPTAMIAQIIMLERYGKWEDEDSLHPINDKPNRRFRVKGDSTTYEMDPKSHQFRRDVPWAEVEWMESYTDYARRLLCNDKEISVKINDKISIELVNRNLTDAEVWEVLHERHPEVKYVSKMNWGIPSPLPIW